MVFVEGLKIKCVKSPSCIPIILTVECLKGEKAFNIEWNSTTSLDIITDDGSTVSFTTVNSICRFLSRLCSNRMLYGNSDLEKTEVDHWIEYSNRKYSADFINYLSKIDDALSRGTFLVGHTSTLADICMWSALVVSKQWQTCKQKEIAPQNLLRWYRYLSSLSEFSVVQKLFPNCIPCEALSDSVGKQSKCEDKGKFVELPGAEMGKVVVRFPPEASGYLHIGHAKAALLNSYYQISFKGKLIMRFDDTNPEKEKEDFEKVILEDVAMLEIKPDIYSYTSDYFPVILEKCEQLIKSYLAYIDDTDSETMKKEREQRIESRNRDNTVDKNLSMWEEMRKGTDYGKQCCVRAKIYMNSDNGCMRDPTLYRCKATAHPRTGEMFKVYPTYDFACPIVDSIEGVTHALRTTEYHDRDDQYFWILNALGLRQPHIYEYSRLNMTNTVLSKRKLAWFVEQGIVEGWEDPRMPTVRGVLRRGMTVEGLKQFIVAQGSSRSVVVMEWDKIWAFNKKVIDPIAPRYNAVEKEKAVPVFVEDASKGVLEVSKHPKNPSLGTKMVEIGAKLLIDQVDAKTMAINENVTFINWGNLLIKEIIKNELGDVEKIIAKLNLDDKDFKKTLKVTWLADSDDSSLVPCVCVYYDHLISKAVLEKDDDFKDFLSDNTKISVMMFGDPEMSSLKKGDIIQIQRKGFFICDEPYDPSTMRYTSREMPLVLISIPDGSKDTTNLPNAVKILREKGESLKEIKHRIKGKVAEKSPQDSQDIVTSLQSVSQLGDNQDSNSLSGDIKTLQELNDRIKSQGDMIRQMKQEKVEKKCLDPSVKALLQLKDQYKMLSGTEWKPGGSVHVTKVGVPTESLGFSHSSIELHKQVKEQGDKIREMKSEKVPKDVLEPVVKHLLSLKSSYKALTGRDWHPEIGKMELESQKIYALKEQHSTIEDQGDITKMVGIDKTVEDNLKSEGKDFSLNSNYLVLTEKENVKTPFFSHEELKPLDTTYATFLNEQIKEQGDKIRKLKSEKITKAALEPELKKLLSLKSDYKSLTDKEWKPATEETLTCTKSYKNSSPIKEKVDSDISLLDQQIIQQGDKVRKMKSEKIAKDILDDAIKCLLDLKSKYKSATGFDWKPSAERNSNAKHKNKSPDKKVKSQNVPKESLKDDSCKKKNKTGGIETIVPKEKVSENDSLILGSKKMTRLGLEVRKEENFSEWYSQVITKAELIEYYDVSGCYILRPLAFSIWEYITQFFDPEIKALGVSNCYFPMFVSSSALEREKTHVADFAPEVAWVTKSGSSDLSEPIAIRPTSETVMYPSYAKWIKSHRDLPLQLNQWCSVVRWEFKHPQPFIRTREFLWQEGHTAFAEQGEAIEEVYKILDLYASIYEDLLAIPVIRGRKTEKEKFAGADFTITVEAFVSINGRAIQGATSHHLGQNFSKMFEIIFEDPETSEKCYVYQNSWGLSTRTIGVMVMVHGDNIGLVLPPRVATYQVVIVPCGIVANFLASDKVSLIDKCKELEKTLHESGVRVKGDYRDNYTPGWKYNHWELKGVPIRIELGPRDVSNKQFVAVRRDTGEKKVIMLENACQTVKELLNIIQQNLFCKAKAVLEKHLVIAMNWNDFCTKLENRCIIQSPFCGEISCEDQIKKDSAKTSDDLLEPGAPSMGAKTLCIPFNQPEKISSEMKCINPSCQNKPKYFTVFGRSY